MSGPKMATSSSILFWLNGQRIEVESNKVYTSHGEGATVLGVLRGEGALCRATSVKRGCGEGGCGACTVLVSQRGDTGISHRSMAACLIPICAIHGLHITTVEGLARIQPDHRVLECVARSHGTQCGYCSPGVVMAMYSALRSNPDADVHQLEATLDGNLCRCTGYRPLLDICKLLTNSDCTHPLVPMLKDKDDSHFDSVLDSWLNDLPSVPPLSYRFGDGGVWNEPDSVQALAQARTLKSRIIAGAQSHPSLPTSCSSFVVAGYTEMGYAERYHPHHSALSYLSLARVKELHAIHISEDRKSVTFGAAVPLNQCRDVALSLDQQDGSVWHALALQLRFFGNNQVRDMGTIGGSVCTADPLGDLIPVLVAVDAECELVCWREGQLNSRFLKIDCFYGKDGKPALEYDELLSAVTIRDTGGHVQAYKHSKRRVDAQAIVTACMSARESEVRICVGGGASRPALRAHSTERALSSIAWPWPPCQRDSDDDGQTSMPLPLDSPSVAKAVAAILEDVEQVPLMEPRKGSVWYRTSILQNMVRRFYWSVSASPLAGERYPSPIHQGSLLVLPPPSETDISCSNDTIVPIIDESHALPHPSAAAHVSGSAVYVGDEPLSSDTLHAALILSRHAHARIVTLGEDVSLPLQDRRQDLINRVSSEAEYGQSLRGIYYASDVPGNNYFGSGGFLDEPLFAGDVGDEVYFFGQIIGIVVASDRTAAYSLADYISAHIIRLDPLPACTTLTAAIEENRFFDFHGQSERVLHHGDVVRALEEGAKQSLSISGSVSTEGQDHMCIEPQIVKVSMSGGAGTTVNVSAASQHAAHVQRAVASVLGIQGAQVAVRSERIGGGFGGKQDRPAFLAAVTAVACHLSHAPVRLELTREVDMSVCGGRHQFRCDFKAAFAKCPNADGHMISALDADIYVNAGWTRDLSIATLEVGMMSLDNCYRIPNFHIRGRACRTNHVSNTAFRGFGKPECIAIIESILDHACRKLHLDPILLRTNSLYQQGDCIGYRSDEIPIGVELKRCWNEVRSQYVEARTEVAQFNASHATKKRGIGVIPVKSNVGFDVNSMSQVSALICIYQDGSLLVSHGGCEMGQGLIAKLQTLVLRTLREELPNAATGLSLNQIRMATTSTESVPNAPPTAAVSGTDLHGGAVVSAARELASRLRKCARGTWTDTVNAAYLERIPLSATGFFKMPPFAYNWDTRRGAFTYYSIFGAVLATVEVDVLSGSWRVIRALCVQDCGKSLNIAIDVGQIEGGFMMGMGMCMMEQLVWAKDGHLRTRNVSTYKVPTHDDTPVQFDVCVLGHRSDGREAKSKLNKPGEGVYGSKAVGEAGVSMGVAVAVAAIDAIHSCRSSPASPFSIPLSTEALYTKMWKE